MPSCVLCQTEVTLRTFFTFWQARAELFFSKSCSLFLTSLLQLLPVMQQAPSWVMISPRGSWLPFCSKELLCCLFRLVIYYLQVGQGLAHHIVKSFLCLNHLAFVDLQTVLCAMPQLLQTAGLCPAQHPLVCDPRDREALSESLPLWPSSSPGTARVALAEAGSA